MKIIRDTREKSGFWTFGSDNTYLVRKLETGDYTVEGYEDTISFERKKSVAEVAKNITEKRFWAEVERLKEIEHAYLVCEFTTQDVVTFPQSANLNPFIKNKIRIRGSFILKKLQEIEESGIRVIFAGSRENAIEIVKEILNAILIKE